MLAFEPTDLFRFGELLTEAQRLVASSVREFVQKEFKARIRSCYREEKFPEDLIPKLGEMGLLGANLTGYGLPGMDPISYGLSMRELERCDSALRSFASVQGALVMYAIWQFGSEAQKQEWLPRLGRGEAVGCFGLTESEGGSDPGAMKTSAAERDGEIVINGSKAWITNGNLAQIAVVWAKTQEGIRGFLVPTSTPGFKAVKMEGKLSLRASVTSQLFFDEVRVPHLALLPKSQGLKSALECLNQARYGIAWGVVGAAEACFEEALRYVKERVIFDRKLASYQLIQRKLALLASRITQAQLLALRLGQLKQEGSIHFSQISLAKQNNVEMALECARVCRDLLGGNGIMDEYSVMRHLCNLESVSTYEGTNDIHLLIVGHALTGTPAYS